MNAPNKTIARHRFGLTVAATALSMVSFAGVAAANPSVSNIGPGPSTNHVGVRCIQSAVGARIDGLFGQETYTKVKRFQKAHHLSVDGIVGPHTGDAIVKVDDRQGYTGCYKYVPTTYKRGARDAQLESGSDKTPLVQS